jgi:glycogen synthase
VIAFGRGGATETVIPTRAADRVAGQDEPTGLWFEEQTLDSLVTAMEDFEACQDNFNPAAAHRQALRFNKQRFATEIVGFVDQVYQGNRPRERLAA